MLSDPIADMLTRIRNAAGAGKETVNIKASKICAGIAEVLKQEGFIEGFDRIDDNKQGLLRVGLKYSVEGEPIIRTLKRQSKPGKRVYSSVKDLPVVLGGMGVVIVSTSKGVMTDKQCREENISGEIICTVS